MKTPLQLVHSIFPAAITPTIYHNPNQFVDQGYNNFGTDRQQSFNGARGPISQQPTVLQR